eukprot:gnl/TRDRNA2_/TRDRNA2_60311_c0_seq1.p1 gnl/TRDRNA2_/TRDRNA2_60311_c0~~gnl/TRDRNA2_/TRDRNA2_60311_c0_seq1.p1  ORF type:complete len:117 (+),score=20.18 gnl/TRDRNA2_/TRDRNA2_60311_c0_seq1:69-419(+)
MAVRENEVAETGAQGAESSQTELTAALIRNCFSVTQLAEWSGESRNKSLIGALRKRMDVVMAMEYRAAHREGCTARQARDLELFEEQFKNRKRRDQEIRAKAAKTAIRRSRNADIV